MQAKWQGIELQEVYKEWAQVLYNCSVGAIEFALIESRIRHHPPSLGEFLEYTAKYIPKQLQIEGRTPYPQNYLTKEEINRRVKTIKKMLNEHVIMPEHPFKNWKEADDYLASNPPINTKKWSGANVVESIGDTWELGRE